MGCGNVIIVIDITFNFCSKIRKENKLVENKDGVHVDHNGG